MEAAQSFALEKSKKNSEKSCLLKHFVLQTLNQQALKQFTPKMIGFNRKYCEIVPEQPVAADWREIVLETGALQSIQDIKVSFRIFYRLYL